MAIVHLIKIVNCILHERSNFSYYYLIAGINGGKNFPAYFLWQTFSLSPSPWQWIQLSKRLFQLKRIVDLLHLSAHSRSSSPSIFLIGQVDSDKVSLPILMQHRWISFHYIRNNDKSKFLHRICGISVISGDYFISEDIISLLATLWKSLRSFLFIPVAKRWNNEGSEVRAIG